MVKWSAAMEGRVSKLVVSGELTSGMVLAVKNVSLKCLQDVLRFGNINCYYMANGYMMVSDRVSSVFQTSHAKTCSRTWTAGDLNLFRISLLLTYMEGYINQSGRVAS